MSWCEKAAEQNDADALFLLAELYELGTGVQQDLRQAISYYSKVEGADGLTSGMSRDALSALERLREIIK